MLKLSYKVNTAIKSEDYFNSIIKNQLLIHLKNKGYNAEIFPLKQFPGGAEEVVLIINLSEEQFMLPICDITSNLFRVINKFTHDEGLNQWKPEIFNYTLNDIIGY